MTRQEKDALISDLADRLSKSEVFYLTDISSLNAETLVNCADFASKKKCN